MLLLRWRFLLGAFVVVPAEKGRTPTALASCVVLISRPARLSVDDVATFLKGRARSRALRPFQKQLGCVVCVPRACCVCEDGAAVVIGASVNSLGTLSAGRADTVHCLPPPRSCAARLLDEPLSR